jgi:hypothetical protein
MDWPRIPAQPLAPVPRQLCHRRAYRQSGRPNTQSDDAAVCSLAKREVIQ